MDYKANGSNSESGSMESNPRLKKGIRDLFLTKQQRRRELAGLSIERKVRILISMQKIAAGLSRRAADVQHRPWSVH